MQEKQQSFASSTNKPNFGNRGNDGDGNKKRWSKKPARNFVKQQDEFTEKLIKVNRVTKVTKGGRHFRFSVVVIVGDYKGRLGFATGKANEVPDAIKKAARTAKKNCFKVPIIGTTIPHDILGKFGSSEILIKPAKKGTGVIAGGPVRALIELSGIQDIYAKSLGSNNSLNMIRATMQGLQQLRTKEQIYSLREVNKLSSETHK